MQNPRFFTLSRCIAAPLVVSFLVVAACSSSDSGTPATSAADGGPTSDGSPGSDGASSVDGAMPGTDAAVVTDSGAAGPCAFSLAGGYTAPTTSAPNGCSNSKIEQVNGMGDYTASIGGGFYAADKSIVTLACTLLSPTPPAAGSTWTMTLDPKTQGNCQLSVTKGTSASSWASSSIGVMLSGTLSMTFKSVTMVHGTQHPNDVFYLFDLTLSGSVEGLQMGETEVTIQGTFSSTMPPLGS